MKKRLMMALAVGALMAAMVPGVAAANEPVGDCPADFTLRTLANDDGTAPGYNGDGYSCLSPVRPRAGTVGFKTGLDNVVPIRE